MTHYMDYISLIFQALTANGQELIGAFLMAATISLMFAKGTQKEGFNYFSIGFSFLFFWNVLSSFFFLQPRIYPYNLISGEEIILINICCCAITAALFIVGALKNLHFYFSGTSLTILLAFLIGGINLMIPIIFQQSFLLTHLQSLILSVSFFVIALSFFINKTNFHNNFTKSMGMGFTVLGICYFYQSIGLMQEIKSGLLICYIIALILSLAAQIQFLNRHVKNLESDLEKEKINREKMWDISPFPVLLSRLRDDTIVYMNPIMQQMLSLEKKEALYYPLSAYFPNDEKRQELNNLIQQKKIIHSFEVELHHPQKENQCKIWADLSTRTVDYDGEIMLYTTFKDISEQKNRTQQLQHQAATDPLTGLNNRRQFELLVQQALLSAQRYGYPYSLGMLDIDFFKKVNDTYGHDAGDAVLKKLSETLQKVLRKSDIIARFGGEEFVIFFTHTIPENALIPAEHIRQAIEKMDVVVGNTHIPVTVSIGISGSFIPNMNTLLKEADEALYHSKQNGRNQVTLHSILHPLPNVSNGLSQEEDDVIELCNPLPEKDEDTSDMTKDSK